MPGIQNHPQGTEHRLQPGLHTDDLQAAPSADDRLQHALGLAYRYLNRRDRTEAEMRSHLQARGVDVAESDQAICTLTEQGYLDDARFARLFTQDKRELERWGRDRIARGLRARGIEPELIHPALDSESPDSELDRALRLLRRRLQAPPADRRERDRALGLLLRKGYDGELALDALAAYARGD
ncbi:MAG: RecX family transcriptional regulator [Actinomycetota bacterium]|nr:RecX family transcriptional regulator [Actinomycetota bacterium]